jgi:HD-GYP domain-containing protein (c-di-GMP phosphodiesterase class II)
MVGTVALPLMFVTFLVGHVGFATYSRMREAHEATVRGLVKAIEALDPYTKGHTERVATFCRMTAERLGFDAEELEMLRWAALIHDVGKVAAPPQLLRSDGTLDAVERRHLIRSMRVVEEMLARVDFLAPAVAVVSAQHELPDDGTADPAARILAAADAFDLMTSSRSYRSAVTQPQAFAGLRASAASYGGDVVEALIGAIEASGQVYGSPDVRSSAEVEEMVRERARRA